jgi:hypothetical protein
MRLVILLAAVILSFANYSDGWAQDRRNDVQNLYNDCRAPMGSFENSICLGFVSGIGRHMFNVGDSFKKLRENDPKNEGRVTAILFPLSACSKSRVSNGAMVQAFVNWAGRHPERWSDERYAGVWEAIRETWPCLPGNF